MTSGTPWRLLAIGISLTIPLNSQFYFTAGMLNTAVLSFRKLFNESDAGQLTEDEFSVMFGGLRFSLFISQVSAVFLAPWVSERLGRKGALLIGELFSLVGTGIACLYGTAYPHWSLIVGTSIIGIHVGVVNSILPVYMTEVSTARYRGILAVCLELASSLSLCFGTIAGFPEALGNQIRILYLVGAIPPALGAFGLLFCPDTPKYLLLTRGDEQKARKAILFFQPDADADEMMQLINAEKHNDDEEFSNRYARKGPRDL